MLEIKFHWYEVSVAIHIVNLRHVESLRKGLRDAHGYKGRDMQDNLWGVLGEIGFAKAMNVYYPMTVNTFKQADVGRNWQVRTVGSNKNRSLLIRPVDPTPHKYMLVEVYKDKYAFTYHAKLLGWIEGIDGKDDKYLTDCGHPDRPKVYRIPQKDLRNPILATA